MTSGAAPSGGDGWPPAVFDPAGPYSEPVTILAWVLVLGGALVFTIVIAALWVALRGSPRLKARLGGEKAIWTLGFAFPAVVLTGLLIWGLTLTSSLSATRVTGGEMRVKIIGEMWWWRVHYLDAGGRETLRDANELHIPVGKPVLLELEAADVIHSFWVPRLGGKMDMIPGRTNRLLIQADAPGIYKGQCAEYCGGPHALIRGTPANGLAGPDLTHVGSRRTRGAGILPNNPGTMAGWIADAQAIKPANRMPAYHQFSGEELRALSDYMVSLK